MGLFENRLEMAYQAAALGLTGIARLCACDACHCETIIYDCLRRANLMCFNCRHDHHEGVQSAPSSDHRPTP